MQDKKDLTPKVSVLAVHMTGGYVRNLDFFYHQPTLNAAASVAPGREFRNREAVLYTARVRTSSGFKVPQ